MPIVAAVGRVEQLQLVGQEVVVAEAEDGVDRLADLQSIEPLGAHVIGCHGSRTHHEHEAIARGDSVAHLLQERECPARHRLAVPPDRETARGQVAIQSFDERLVVTAGRGEEEGGHGNANPSDLARGIAKARSTGKAAASHSRNQSSDIESCKGYDNPGTGSVGSTAPAGARATTSMRSDRDCHARKGFASRTCHKNPMVRLWFDG